VPTAAQRLLRSNVLISREYTNEKTEERANFLLVQCSDARDLDGHFPPNCYRNAGYTLAPDPKPDPDIVAPGTVYKFTQDTINGTRAMWVFNMYVAAGRPDGAGHGWGGSDRAKPADALVRGGGNSGDHGSGHAGRGSYEGRESAVRERPGR